MTRLGPLLSPLLIGRDDIVDLAARRIDETRRGQGQFILLSGEAGIGKSRLLHAIRDLTESQGFGVADGALAPQDRDVPAAIFLDLARSMARQPAFDDLGSQLLDLVTSLIGADRPERRLLVQQVAHLLARSDARPTLLVFEDLQWSDDMSLEILAELARQTRTTRTMLAGAYRSDDPAAAAGSSLREWRGRLVTQRLVDEARLGRLTLDQTALMTSLILGSGLPAPRAVVRAVHERTDGVPLHIEELLGALGSPARHDSRAILDAAVPESLEDAIMRRVRRLSPEAQAVARAGAVIGRSFVPEVLAGVMDLPVAEIDEPIQELIDNAVLDGPGRRGLLDYRHQLLRDALYRSMPTAERRRYHARAAEFGARLEGASEIHASLHFELAGMREEAFRAALAGARGAARLASHREATELYRRAIDNLPSDLPTVERAAILLAYSNEASLIEDNELCEELARSAREAYLEGGDRLGAARALLNVAIVWRWEGRPLGDRLALLESIVAELAGLEPSRDLHVARQVAYGLLAWAWMDQGDLGRARDAVLAAQASVAATGLTADGIDPAVWIGTLDVLDGRVAAGLDRIGEAAERLEALGYTDGCVTAYRDEALLAVRSMEFVQASLRIENGRRYADRLELTHCGRVMAATDSLIAWATGDWNGARKMAEQSLADHDHGRAGAIARWALGYVAMGRGQVEVASSYLEAAADFGRRADWPEMTLPATWGLAEVALQSGDAGRAVEICEEALATAEARDDRDLLAPFVVTGVRAYVAVGRPAGADDWLERVSGVVGSAPASAAAIVHARGLVRLAAGSLTAAREALEAAAAAWDTKGRRWEALWARLDLASAMLRSNRYVEAARLTGEVRLAAQAMESGPLLSRTSAIERVARGRGAAPEAWHPLTVREFEVARLIAVGMTNPEIATELDLSPKTVSAHVEHMLAKLGVARRAEIAAWVASVAPDQDGARRPAEAAGAGRVTGGG